MQLAHIATGFLADCNPKVLKGLILAQKHNILVLKPKSPKAQNHFGIPDLSRNPETISGFPKIWFGIGIEIEIPEIFGLRIGTKVSVWDPIPNHP